jgi:hypothetical protein
MELLWWATGTLRELAKMEKRLQIDFSEKAYRELETLQELLDATSKSEVIRDALGLLRWLAQEVVEKGHRILVEKPEDGTTREMVFHFLERSKSERDAVTALRSQN